jgi:hypothetical protein
VVCGANRSHINANIHACYCHGLQLILCACDLQQTKDHLRQKDPVGASSELWLKDLSIDNDLLDALRLSKGDPSNFIYGTLDDRQVKEDW